MSRMEESLRKRPVEYEMKRTTRDKTDASESRTGLVTSFVRHFSICSEIVKANGSKGPHPIKS